MTLQEAKNILLAEGYPAEDSLDAMYVQVRGGEEPPPERMRRLLDALTVVFEALQGETVLERPLAAALWVLGSTIPEDVVSRERAGRRWRSGFLNEVVEMTTWIESIFLDARLFPGVETIQ